MRCVGWVVAMGLAGLSSGCGRDAVEPFSTLDRDGNGRISREEARFDAGLDRAFAQADADEDGELTPREYIRVAASR